MRRRTLWRVGGAALLAAALGWIVEPRAFYGGWLAAVTVIAGWSLGSLALVLIHPLTGGRWGEALRPALSAAICALALLPLAGAPLGIGVPDLYAWARHGAHPANAFYLNRPFFAARAVAYLIVWLALGALALRGAAPGRIAPPALLLLGLTVSFAAVDTTMSLDPGFVSSVYGMMTAAGMVLLALSAAILGRAGAAAPELLADLGKLLLALVILFIYLDFMQLLIVWQSDLASESPWYLMHARGGWGAVRGVIAAGHFVLPFALLLSPRWQRSRAVVRCVAALLVAMEVLRAWWTVLPATGRGVGWVDIACMLGLGGVALAFGGWAAERPGIAGSPRHV